MGNEIPLTELALDLTRLPQPLTGKFARFAGTEKSDCSDFQLENGAKISTDPEIVFGHLD